ncbi:septation ring formation regulator EzrA [Holzapfeliella sp. He02]|uniref:Septation ring formation regulator EzrA n=1 Tax=Holzapfeliella saturejae TaxID=3082953 RepID=A0ABU8SG01_9LACO
MSVGQTVVLSISILIILAVVIQLLMNFVRNKRVTTHIGAVIDAFQSAELDEKYQHLKGITLSGSSLITFNNWAKVYLGIESRSEELQQKNQKVAQTTNHLRLLTANALLADLKQEVFEAEQDVEDVESVFDQLIAANSESEQEIEQIYDKYAAMRKDILSKSYNYGQTIHFLEDYLLGLENKFSDVRKLNNEGNHIETHRVLSYLRLQLNHLAQKLPRIKKSYEKLSDKLPKQVKEISDDYQQLLNQGYRFSNVNVQTLIDNLNATLNQANQQLNEIKLDEVESSIDSITNKMMEIEQILENEMNAKNFVMDFQTRLSEQFEKVSLASSELMDLLVHIDQSYILTNDEITESGHIGSEISQMKNDFDLDLRKIETESPVYSEIKADFLRINQRLDEIAIRQQEIQQDIEGLTEAEKVAQQSVQEMNLNLNMLKRKLDRYKLPGYPARFIEYYRLVEAEIEKIYNELNQVKIDMKQISDDLILAQQDLNKLTTDSENIVAVSELTEIAIQYSNKYIQDNQGINEAVRKAYQLYNQDFDYEGALDVIASALEKVEPGAYQKIENDYYKGL